jgi:hypothetical protein
MIIIGVDPGKITGLALWQELTSETLGSGTVIGPIKSWAVAEVGPTQVLPYIRALLRGRKPTLIACERYVQGTGRRAMSYQGDAQHITGEISGLAQELECQFVRQLAGPAKKTGNDQVLKTVGCYTSTPDGHANDACRQVIRALATFYPETYARLVGI